MRSLDLIILVARTKLGFGVLVGSDVCEDFAEHSAAVACAAERCAAAQARGESLSWVDVSQACAPLALRRET